MLSEPIIFECGGCMAYMAHPGKADVGECRRHAPVPLVTVTRERPEVDEHGRVRGFRLTVWPGVGAGDSCCEFQPSHATMEKVARQQAEKDANAEREAGRLN